MWILGIRIWIPVHDEGDPDLKEFTPEQQEKINAILAIEKRKHTDKTKKALDELEALRSKATLTTKERSELDKRIETLQQELLTKEEQAKHETAKLKKISEEHIQSLEKGLEDWKNRYTTATIATALTQAAIEHKAKNPQHIISLLGPITHLAEKLDDEGKPTGNFIPKVRFDTVKDGKPITLELPPSEAVKRLSEMDEHLNLFNPDGSGGTGRQHRDQQTGKVDIHELVKDPSAYRKARKEGKIAELA